MIIEAGIFTRLQALVTGRCYVNAFPQSPTTPVFPAIVYHRISTVPGEDICGNGDDAEADVRIQIDMVTKSYGATVTLRDQVKTAMADFDPPAIWDGEQWFYEPETKTHQCSLDYLFYPSSA